MKRVISFAIILAAALAACFGAGPAPVPPPGVTVVYVAPLADHDHQCNGSAVYIGDVAVGAELGYAALVTYAPPNCNESGGSMQTSFVSFDKAGANPNGSSISSSTTMTSLGGRIAADGPDFVWISAFGQNDQLGGLVAPPIGIMASGSASLGGSLVGLALDTDGVYFTSDQMVGGALPDLDAPSFPCCGLQSSSLNMPANVWKLPRPLAVSADSAMPTLITSSITLATAEMKAEMIDSPSHLYVMATGDAQMGTAATIKAIRKSDASVTTIDTLSVSLATRITPVGLDASENFVVWAAAIDATSTNTVPGGCWVFAHDLTAGSTKLLLQTTRFSCLDAALDDTSVYFTIVSNPQIPGDNCNNGNCTEPFHGDGIGRVSLTDGTFESIALGISTFAAGPRRIYLDGDALLAVDPLAIARISKSKLDGSQDFSQ